MQTIKILNNKYSGRRGKIQIDATLSYLYKTDSFVSKNMRSLEFLDAWASLGLAMVFSRTHLRSSFTPEEGPSCSDFQWYYIIYYSKD